MKYNSSLIKTIAAGLLAFQFISCSNSPATITASGKTEGAASGDWSGKLVTEYSSDLRYYDFDTKKETTVFKEARQPFATKSGDVIFVSGKFPKTGKAIQQADAAFNNNNQVLDLTDWFGGSLFSPKLSPDGSKLAVTVTSYSDYKIDSDAVLVFDKGGNVIARFNNKYMADWTPDGRLVMTGSIKNESVDGSVRTKATPGIYVSDATLSTVTRIDPNLNDPAPYHAAVSPDGKKIAFIKNDHVWTINIDGSDLKQITAADNDNIETFPTWSPDGDYIACWCYKTFENSYYTAIAIVPSSPEKPIALANDAQVWPRDPEGNRVSGGAMQFSWVKK